MRFVDQLVSCEGRFSIGVDTKTADPYLSISVKNSVIDYEEYYRLSVEEHVLFKADEVAAIDFAGECRRRLHDDRLILQPGGERGEPW